MTTQSDTQAFPYPPPLAAAPPVPPPGWKPPTARPRTARAVSAGDGVKITTALSAFIETARQRTAAFREEIAPALDAAPQTLTCEFHPEAMLDLDREETIAASWREEAGLRLVYSPCHFCAAEAVASAARRYWARRGVPDRLLDATFDSFWLDTPPREAAHAKALAYALKAKAPLNPREDTSRIRGGFLLCLGPVGTGKSHLAVATMKHFAAGGMFTTHADLMSDLRATYGTGTTSDFVDGLKLAPVLILDEWGPRATGADEAPVMYQIFAARHDKRLPTIITSNEEASTIKDGLGYRLVDRIREDLAMVNFHGESFRTGQ